MVQGITAKETGVRQGKKIVVFRLCNNSGACVELINYGATIVSAIVPDRFGNMENIILNYPDMEDYISGFCYLGSTIGRFANRIAGAQFKLNGKIYCLEKNDGENTNHGGFHGFNSQIFDYEIHDNQVIFSYESADGAGGFPGNLHFSVAYSFSENNELNIEYKAVSDKETVFNPTNHAYFDLSAGKANPLDFELKVFAETYLESNDQFLPTGKILPVAGTSFDFREYRKISELMPLKNEVIKGYNTYFIGKKTLPEKFLLLASLKDNSSGRLLEVYSDMPGILLYTGDYLSGTHQAFSGLCLEAQFYPDAPNQQHFPSCLILPSQKVSYNIQYKFGLITSQ